MRTMTADVVCQLLKHLDRIEGLTNSMRVNIRPPTFEELYPAAASVTAIREMLLIHSLTDIAVEPIAPDALPERVMVEAA